MQDRIERTVDLNAPIARVWRALTDHEEFGEWFRAKLDGPFVVGERSLGRITYPGCEHMKWKAMVKAIEPQRLFSFTWCPYNDEPSDDDEPQTLVEFKLEPIPTGTRLTIIESGFSALPDDARRIDALRMNNQGWDEQVKNISAHVAS